MKNFEISDSDNMHTHQNVHMSITHSGLLSYCTVQLEGNAYTTVYVQKHNIKIMSLKERLEINRSCLFFMYILRRVAFCYFIFENHQLFEFSHSFEHSYPMCRVFDKPLSHSTGAMQTLNDRPTIKELLLHFGTTLFSLSIEILYDCPIIADHAAVGM